MPLQGGDGGAGAVEGTDKRTGLPEKNRQHCSLTGMTEFLPPVTSTSIVSYVRDGNVMFVNFLFVEYKGIDLPPISWVVYTYLSSIWRALHVCTLQNCTVL